MSTDIRKWMNLVENEEGTWYDHWQLQKLLVDRRYRHIKGLNAEWKGVLAGLPQDRILFKAQDLFQKWVRSELKPIWIIDVRIH